MIYLYLFGTCFHFIYVFMIIGNNKMILLPMVANPAIGREVFIRTNIYIFLSLSILPSNIVYNRS